MPERNVESTTVQPVPQIKARNQSIECFRIFASIAVVFIHYKFPGILGVVMDCLARVAVPFFFAVSGYFVYQADETKIRKRINSLVKLNIWSTLFYLLLGCYKEKYIYHRGRLAWLLDRLEIRRLSRWIIISLNPFSDHLWYLAAILECYLILYIYVRWQGKKHNYYSLYICSFFLYSIHIAMSSSITSVGLGVPYELYRNALFFGMPMFSLGIFIREYHQRIIETYRLSKRRLVTIIFVGAAFSVFQWLGTGEVEMPLGTLFEVIALMLLLGSLPHVFQSYPFLSMITSKLGELSLYIYVAHPFWINIYDWYIEEYISVWGETLTKYLSPILVVLLSVFTGVIWIFMKATIKKIKFRGK